MTHKPSPNAVRVAVEDAVIGAVDRAVYWAVHGAVHDAGAVDDAVFDAGAGAVFLSVLDSPPHPNLDRFLVGIRQARWGAA